MGDALGEPGQPALTRPAGRAATGARVPARALVGKPHLTARRVEQVVHLQRATHPGLGSVGSPLSAQFVGHPLQQCPHRVAHRLDTVLRLTITQRRQDRDIDDDPHAGADENLDDPVDEQARVVLVVTREDEQRGRRHRDPLAP